MSSRAMLAIGYAASLLAAVLVIGMAVSPQFVLATVAPGEPSGWLGFIAVNGFLFVFWLSMLYDHLSHRPDGSSRAPTIALALLGYPAALVYFWVVVAARGQSEAPE